MSRVALSTAAVDDLERLLRTHSLPAGTKQRVKRSLEPLGRLPLLGAALEGRWSSFRFVLGPWRWMIVVYVVAEPGDRVVVVTIQDGRSAQAPSASR